MANGQQVPVPNPPDFTSPGAVPVAPGQLLTVMPLSGPYKGQPRMVSVEKYVSLPEESKKLVDVLIPAKDKEGKSTWARASQWTKAYSQGYRPDLSHVEQLSGVYQLSRKLQEENLSALERFLSPFWDAITMGVPPSLKKGEIPGVKEVATQAVKNDPFYQLVIGPMRRAFDIPAIWKSKTSDTTEKFTRTIESAPVPFVPSIAMGAEKLGKGDLAGALGEFGVVGGMWLLGQLGPKVSEYITEPLGEKIPDVTIGTRQARNVGAQREIVAKTNEIAPNLAASDLSQIRNSAGAEIKTAQQLNEDAERFEREFNERRKQQEAIDKANLSDVAKRGKVAAEQARRVIDLNDVNRLATEVSGAPGRPPIQEAEQVIEVVRGTQGATDEIERAIYPYVYQQAEAAGVEVRLYPVGQEIAQTAGAAIRAQEKLGVGGIRPNTAEGLRNIQQGIFGGLTSFMSELPTEQAEAIGEVVSQATQPQEVALNDPRLVRALRHAPAVEPLVGSLEYSSATEMFNDPEIWPLLEQTLREEIEQARTQVSQAPAGEPSVQRGAAQVTTVPFETADQARRGLGSILRSMRKAKTNNPELAPDIMALQRVESALKQQIQESLSRHPKVHELYDVAHDVTVEQHNVIDQNVIKKIFTDPRNRLTGETLVNALLKTGTEKLQGAILQVLDVGPAARQALESISSIKPEEAARISQRIADLAAPSAEAKAGLRDMVVRAAIRKGTELSETEGATASRLNYNAMIQFLDADVRPGAKILLGDRYEPLMRDLRARADAALRQTDPTFENFIQREAARYEIKRTPAKPPAGAEDVAQEMSEPEFVKKLMKEGDFRRGVLRNSTPEIKQRILRSIVQDVVGRSMERGMPGSPDAIMDFESFAKNMNDAGDALAAFGNNDAVRTLQGLGRAMERASASAKTGWVGRVYFWYRGPGNLPFEPRLTGRSQYGPLLVGPQEVAAAVKSGTPPVVLPDVPRSLDLDIFKASQDPALANMMKRAMKMEPWEPGAKTFALKYYLAFAGGHGKQDKALDDRTAQDLLIQTGGKIDDAVKAAQAMGYTR